MRMTRSTPSQGRKGLIAILATVIAPIMALGGGSAYAYFTGHGSGTGTGRVASGLAAVTVTAATTTGAALYPGDTGSPGDLKISATNTNPVDVRVTVTGITGIATGSGCTTPALTLVGTPSFTIPKNTNTSATFPLTGSVTMGTDATSDCQGKTLTVNLTVTVQQS